jgi:uncharacterized membrane protein
VSTAPEVPSPRRRTARRDLSARDYANFLIRSLAITLAIAWMVSGGRVFTAQFWTFASFHPHWPNWTPLTSAGMAIQVHVATVVAAALIGVLLIAGLKGTRLHRRLGYAYMVAMFGTAVVTLFIPPASFGPHLGPFGPLHLFSLFTLIGVPAALWFARRGQWLIHGRIMGGLFVGGIGIAGIGAFMPGRIMYQIFCG